MAKTPEEIVSECDALKVELQRLVDGLKEGSLTPEDARKIKQATESQIYELLAELQKMVEQEK